METEEAPIQVRYFPKNDAVSLRGTLSQQQPNHQQQRTTTQGCTPMTVLKIIVPVIVLLFLAVAVISVYFFKRIDKLSNSRQELEELPNVKNLTLVDIGPDYFTMSWVPPLVDFDYYWLEVYHIGSNGNIHAPYRLGSCHNGTIIHRDQTELTCYAFTACTNLTIALHTQVKGTLDLTSTGATLQGIFMPGKDPPEVVNLTLASMSKDSVTVSWQRPKGCFDHYVVKTTAGSPTLGMGYDLSVGSCGNERLIGPTETSITCDEIEACSISVTVQTRRSQPLLLTSQGVQLQEILMSKRDPPEVANLTLAATSTDSVTLSWQRPKGCFDLYVVKVTAANNRTGSYYDLNVGSCGNERILDSSETSITCDRISACSVSVMVQTRRSGPLTLTSQGVTLQAIMQKTDPPVPSCHAQIQGKSMLVTWNTAKGCFDKYILDVTYDTSMCIGSQYRSGFSCAGTTVLDPDETSVTCANIPSCGLATVTLRTRQDRTDGRTSIGHANQVLLSEAVLTDLSIDASYTTRDSVIINTRMPNSLTCDSSDCMATVRGNNRTHTEMCYRNSDSGCSSYFKNLQSGTSYTGFISIRHPGSKLIGLKEIGFRTRS